MSQAFFKMLVATCILLNFMLVVRSQKIWTALLVIDVSNRPSAFHVN